MYIDELTYDEPIIIGNSGLVTWTVNNKLVKSLSIGNKEVKSILRTSDNKVIYQKGDLTPTLSLTVNKSILSYTDNDSCVFTAVYSENNGATVQLYNASDDSLVGTMTYNSVNEEYTYSYASANNGNMTVYAQCGNIVSENVNIEDILKYDDATSNETSSYSKHSATTLTYDSTNHYYVTYNSGNDNFEYVMLPLNLNDYSPIIFEADIQIQSDGSNIQPRFGLFYDNNGSYYGGNIHVNQSTNYFRLDKQTGSTNNTLARIQQTFNSGIWYHTVLRYENKTLTASVYDNNNNLIISLNSNVDFTPIGVGFGLVAKNNKIYFKNIKVTNTIPNLYLTCNNSILSYVDSTQANPEIATLTAHYKGGAGATVQLYDSNDLLIGTMTDNNDGTYSYSILSNGSGDRSFYAKYSTIQSETYTIEDCIRVGFKGITLSAPSGRSTSSTVLNDNLIKQSPGSGVGSWGLGLFEYSGDYVMQFKIGSYSTGSGARVGFQSTTVTNDSWTEKGSLTVEIESNNRKISYATSTSSITKLNSSWNLNSIIKVEVTSNTAKIYIDDTLSHTLTLDWLHDPIHLWGHGWSGSGNIGISDFKVKPLEFLSLTSDVSILSYADSESAILTATYSKGSGYDIKLYNAYTNSLIGTMTDNNDGTYSYTYNSQGIGDLEVYAKCGSLVSETFVIQDCYYYDSLTTDKQRYTTVSGTPSISYNSDGLYLTTSVASVCLIRNNFLTLPTDYQAEITITDVASNGYGAGLVFDNCLFDREPTDMSIWDLSSNSRLKNNLTRWQNNDVVKIIKQGTTFSYYLNNNLITSVTVSADNHYQELRTYQNRPSRFKDLKIKPLDSISLTSDVSVLSYVDSDSATLTATYSKGLGYDVKLYDASNDSLISTMTDNNDGTYSYTITSTGEGDRGFYAKYDSVQSETYTIQDCILYDDASSSKTSNYGSSISLRDGGAVTLSYDSTNHYYKITQSTSGDAFLPIISATGLNNFTIEYDAQVNYNTAYGVGSVVYSSSSNWGAIAVQNDKYTIGKMVNGSYTYETPNTSVPSATWLHFKITVSNNSVVFEVYNGTTLITTQTVSYSSNWFSSSTKYGFNHMWDSGKVTSFKNVKIKPLLILSSNKSILSYVNSESAILTATHPSGAGQTVKLYDSSNDSLIGTMTDNLDGTYSYTYSSAGAGDIGFYAKSGSLVSEQYTVHDTWYHTTIIPANTGTDIGNGYMKSIFNNPIALPSSFSIDMLVNSSSSDAASMGTLMLGETSSDFYYHGVMNTNLLACISRNNSRTVLQPSGNNIPKDSDVTITIQYNNGVHTIKYRSSSISVNNNEYTMDYFLGLLYRGVTYKEITINQL